jgi:Uma2 family endonuclease
MTAAEYLAWEHEQVEKHQLIDGEVFAKAGGTPRHNWLCAEVVGVLRSALKGGSCAPFSSDQKIYIPTKAGDFVYPDASVVCGKVRLHEGTTDVVENPRAIVEVLSKSTESYDRGEKWRGYQRIAALNDYVLVSQSVPCIEHFARECDGSWRYRIVGPGASLEISVGAVLVVDEIFSGAFDVPGDD